MADREEPRKPLDLMAEKFRMARARRKWSQVEVARRAGVDEMRVSELEHGRFGRFATVMAVADALGLQVVIGDAA